MWIGVVIGMSKKLPIPPRRLLIAILLLGGVLLTASGATERALGICGLNRLNAKTGAHLESSFQRSLRIFAVLSTIKVGLAVVEGTEVGVGFGLQVGDVVQAAYDYVDIAWRTILAGGVILLGTQSLLAAASLADHWLLAVTLAILALTVLTQGPPLRLHRTHQALRQAGLFMTVLTTACYLLLPLSITGGAYLSSRITAPSIEEAESGLSTLTEDLFSANQTTDGRLLSRWAQTKEQLNHMASYLKEKTSAMVVWILKLIAGYLFDCLVFPVLLFVPLLWLTRGMAKSMFG